MVRLAALILAASCAAGAAADAPQKPHVLNAQSSKHADYPSSSLARGEEGIVRFLVQVDRKDRITSCEVAQSSGYAALDKATCDTVIRNGRFDLDERGNWEVGGKKRLGVMNWVLPADAKRPDTPPEQSSAAEIEEAGQKVTCRYSFKAGSTIFQMKQCHTKTQWVKAEQLSREEAIRLTVGGGYSVN